MKISFKVVGLTALSLSLLASGCGDKGSGGGSGGVAESSFKPLVTKDAKFAIALNLDKDQAFKIVDSYLKMVSDMHVMDEDNLKEATKKIEAWRKDIFADCDPKVLEFVERSGLRDAKLKWAVASMEGFKIARGEPQPDGLCVAIGGKLDLEKVIAACEGEKDCDVSFEKTEVEGEKAWRIVPNRDWQAKKLKNAGIDPCVASLKGRLALVAMSQDTLAKQIRLYKKCMEKGDALGGFSAANGEFLRLDLSGIGEQVKQNAPRSALRQIRGVVPDGDKIVTGLQTLTIDTNVDQNRKLSVTIRLRAASEEDADAFRTLAKTGLMAATAQVANDPGTPEETKKMIKDIKIGGRDGVVEIQSGAFVGALLAVACQNFLRYRGVTQANACISNMKQIQAAMEQAMMAGMAKPTLKDLCGPDRYIKVEPKCPLGGSYVIKYTDNYDYTITCPHADKGHVLPQ